MKRQLNDDEKKQILERFGRTCYATGHEIPTSDKLHFDHIIAYASGGPSELNNIAPMCAEHNRQKGRLPLKDFRTKLRVEKFFKQDERQTLQHLLAFMKEKEGWQEHLFQNISCFIDGNKVKITSADTEAESALHTCPTTKWQYFYATLPVQLIHSDDEDNHAGLQPRYLIKDKVFNLYRHFTKHPVLQPSIGRIVDGKIKIFDGQHKIAGLLWLNRKFFECKVYLSPDVRLLNQTNISAHDKFAQTRFYSSIMVLKLGNQFGADFVKYKDFEDGVKKTEEGFVNFLKQQDTTLTAGDINKRFRSFLFNSVLESNDNNFSKLISNSNRSSDNAPFTIDALTKSILKVMYQQPTCDDLTTDHYKRSQEVENTIWLMNRLYELGFHSYDPKAGKNDNNRLKLDRMMRSKSIQAWSSVLIDVIKASLQIVDQEERERPFYREISTESFKKIDFIIERLFAWSGWQAPCDGEIDRILSDNVKEVSRWFKQKGLTSGYLLGASV